MDLQGLKVIDLQQTDYMRTLETAIQFGMPVVLQNVQEKLDPSLDPVLNKSLMKVGQCSCEILPVMCEQEHYFKSNLLLLSFYMFIQKLR